MDDLTLVAPGIRFSHQGGGGNMNVVMRGLQRIPIGNAPNAVITYFADIPLNFNGSNVPTFDLASVQVLKGPQGTLFGRNAIGGAVIVTPQAPTYNIEGYVRGYGNYDYQVLEGAINVPLVDGKIALRIAGKMTRRDGYTRNLSGGADFDDQHQDSLRASLLIEPTDTIRNITVADWFRGREVGVAPILSVVLSTGLVRVPALAHFFDCRTINAFNPVGCAAVPGVLPPGNDIDDALALQRSLGPRATFSNIPARLDRDIWGVSNKTEFDVSDAITLRNIFGYRHVRLVSDANPDGVAFGPLSIIDGSNRVREEQWSDEVHVFGTLLDDRLDYLVGAFYIREQPTGPEGTFFAVAAAAGPWVIAYTDKTNKAAFGQIGFKVTEGIKLNGGVRYNKTSQNACSLSPTVTVPVSAINGSEPSVGPDACATAAGSSQASVKESATTYNIGLDWQVNDQVFAYITHRKGYREGGLNYPAFNTSVLVPSLDRGAPQTSSIGINVGKRRLTGFEAEVMFQPNRSLTFTNTMAYVKQKLLSTTLPNLPGLQLPSLKPASPKWSSTTSIRWVLPFEPAAGQIVVNGDYYMQSRFFTGNDTFAAYDNVNARLEWSGIGGTGVTAAAFVRNLMNSTYAYAAGASSSSLGLYTRAYNEPRMYGIELGYRF